MVDFIRASGGGGAAPAGGRPVLLDEPFNTDLSAYVADSGSSLAGLVVAGGKLTCADNLDHQFHHPTLNVGDASHVVKIEPPDGTRNYTVLMAAKYIDDNNYVFAQHAGGAQCYIYSNVGGAYTQLATIYNWPLGTLWMVLRTIGDKVYVESWTTDPHLGGNPSESATANLPAALGAGVVGKPGLRLTKLYTGFGLAAALPTLDDWIVAGRVGGRGDF